MVKTVPRPGHEVSSLSSPLTPLALDAAGKWCLNRYRCIAAVGPTQLTRQAAGPIAGRLTGRTLTAPVRTDCTTLADGATIRSVARVSVRVYTDPIAAHLT